VSKVPGTVMRSPTDSSAPRVLSKARSLLVVIGSAAMKACTLTADHVSSELLVTQPLTITLPRWGIEDGVRESMVRESGASAAARTAGVEGVATAGVARPRDTSAARAGNSVVRRGTPRL
jgi:hypothetical protein